MSKRLKFQLRPKRLIVTSDLWKDWSISRNSHSTELAPTDSSELACNNEELLAFWFQHFMLEMRNKHGKEYSPNSLHHFVVGTMRHVRATAAPTIDFPKDGAFANFRKTLDGEMKRLTKTGKSTVKKMQAEQALTDEDEELLWSKGFLGDHSPKSLLNAIFHLISFTSGM